MSLKSLRTLHLEAFNKIIPAWQEIRSSCGGLDAMNYERNFGGYATYTKCTSIVRPGKSDFVADVEISARRVLDAQQLVYFNNYYRDAYGLLDEIPAGRADYDLTVREALGAHFMRVGIYPMGRYYQPKDVRNERS